MNGTLSCSPVNRSRVSRSLVSRSRATRSRVNSRAWVINWTASHSRHLQAYKKSSSRMIRRETGNSSVHHYKGTNGLKQTTTKTRTMQGSEVLLH
jgi:hypothetical protein